MRIQAEHRDATAEMSPADLDPSSGRLGEETAVSLTCRKHIDRPARARCVRCGAILCAACRHKVGHRNFCEKCAAIATRAMSKSGATRKTAKRTRRKSTVLAAALSVVPGLGQLYCGRPVRALILFATSIWMTHALVPRVMASAHLTSTDIGGFSASPSQFVGFGTPVPSFVLSLLPFLALIFLGLCDAVALARRSNRQAATATTPAAAEAPRPKRSLAPDLTFLGLTAAGLGGVIALQNTTAPWLSVTVMWPIALVLFGITVAFSRT